MGRARLSSIVKSGMTAAALAAWLSGCQQLGDNMRRDFNTLADTIKDGMNGEPGNNGPKSSARTKPGKTTAARAKSEPATVAAKAPLAEQGEIIDQPLDLWRKQAELGDAEAQYQLGMAYDSGRGVTRNQASALRWYRAAAEQGHALAALNAGVLYDSGDGVPRDAKAAALWYRKAAETGNGRAAYNLAQLYENGDGVPRDAKQATVWYQRAQKAGIAAAQPRLAALTAKPVVQQASLTPVEGAAAPLAHPVIAAPADPAAAAKTDIPPQDLRASLARDYAPGADTADDAAAAKTIRIAAEAGDAEAACNLGMRYVNGRGVARDWNQGEAWLRKAAARGYVPAQNNLGMLLGSEQNPKADPGEALMWVSKAANAGYGPARAQLGMMYASGRGVAQDSRMADFWLASAERSMREPAGSCRMPAAREAITAR